MMVTKRLVLGIKKVPDRHSQALKRDSPHSDEMNYSE